MDDKPSLESMQEEAQVALKRLKEVFENNGWA